MTKGTKNKKQDNFETIKDQVFNYITDLCRKHLDNDTIAKVSQEEGDEMFNTAINAADQELSENLPKLIEGVDEQTLRGLFMAMASALITRDMAAMHMFDGLAKIPSWLNELTDDLDDDLLGFDDEPAGEAVNAPNDDELEKSVCATFQSIKDFIADTTNKQYHKKGAETFYDRKEAADNDVIKEITKITKSSQSKELRLLAGLLAIDITHHEMNNLDLPHAAMRDMQEYIASNRPLKT